MSSSGYKAQYKVAANGVWQNKLSGTEQSCFGELERLRKQYPFARVVDSSGRQVS